MEQIENVRLLALETLLECEKKNIYVKDSLGKTLFQHQFMSKQNRGFLSRLVEGVTEYQVKLDYIINKFSNIKVNKCKPAIRVILRMGVYQMMFMDSVPNEVACDESVKLAKKKGFRNLSGYVNGVLRAVSNNLDTITYPKREDDLALFLSVEYSMPKWLVEKIIGWYGEELTENILEGSLDTQDLTVRINTSVTSKEAFISELREKNIEVKEGNYIPYALHLNHINYVQRIPGYKQGKFFVQDESSMLLYHILSEKLEEIICGPDKGNKLHILDLCAAPGGKSTHFAQMLGDRVMVEARDITESKVNLIKENTERLQLTNIEAKVSDALFLDKDMISRADVVIADLPCSGLGIMGKKNDIKYHIKEEQLEELSLLQQHILENAVKYVKPEGLLLFSTCTINPEENMKNAEWIMNTGDFEAFDLKASIPESLEKGLIENNMLQLLQGRDLCDGFFIAAFKRL